MNATYCHSFSLTLLGNDVLKLKALFYSKDILRWKGVLAHLLLALSSFIGFVHSLLKNSLLLFHENSLQLFFCVSAHRLPRA